MFNVFILLLLLYRIIVTYLESFAAWYESVEEWFVQEQCTFIQIVLVVEVGTSRLHKAFRCAPDLVQVLYGVRCVRAAVACGACVARLTKFRGHQNQLA